MANMSVDWRDLSRSEEHTSELQSHVRISYAVFCLKKKTLYTQHQGSVVLLSIISNLSVTSSTYLQYEPPAEHN